MYLRDCVCLSVIRLVVCVLVVACMAASCVCVIACLYMCVQDAADIGVERFFTCAQARCLLFSICLSPCLRAW